MLAGRVFGQGLASANHAQDFRFFVEQFFGELSAEVEKGVKAIDRELLRYQQAITSGSTSGDSIRVRINMLTKRLATFSPRFAILLGTYSDATDEATKNIAELAADVRDRIYEINRRYAAARGEDLFKMTTESSKALTTIAAPARDLDGYGKLIDGLYFLVYEGTGSCARLPSPPPEFTMDVKFLRTAIRHDVDHGDAAEIKKKKQRAGEVFERYSGKKTPEECGPEEFVATQLRILKAMLFFLAQVVA